MGRPARGDPPTGLPRAPGPAGLGELADRCSAAAAEAGRPACPRDRLGAAAETLDAALAEMSGWYEGLARVRTTRDGAGDLLAALSAAGLPPADRAELQDALAVLLRDAAALLREHVRR